MCSGNSASYQSLPVKPCGGSGPIAVNILEIMKHPRILEVLKQSRWLYMRVTFNEHNLSIIGTFVEHNRKIFGAVQHSIIGIS